MKKYIILTGTIARMGGAQMYVSNKAKYVKKKRMAGIRLFRG